MIIIIRNLRLNVVQNAHFPEQNSKSAWLKNNIKNAMFKRSIKLTFSYLSIYYSIYCSTHIKIGIKSMSTQALLMISFLYSWKRLWEKLPWIWENTVKFFPTLDKTFRSECWPSNKHKPQAYSLRIALASDKSRFQFNQWFSLNLELVSFFQLIIMKNRWKFGIFNEISNQLVSCVNHHFIYKLSSIIVYFVVKG